MINSFFKRILVLARRSSMMPTEVSIHSEDYDKLCEDCNTEFPFPARLYTTHGHLETIMNVRIKIDNEAERL